MRIYSPTSLQLMFYSNVWASLLTIIGTRMRHARECDALSCISFDPPSTLASFASGEVLEAYRFCQMYPSIIKDLAFYSLLRCVARRRLDVVLLALQF